MVLQQKQKKKKTEQFQFCYYPAFFDRWHSVSSCGYVSFLFIVYYVTDEKWIGFKLPHSAVLKVDLSIKENSILINAWKLGA